MTTDLTFEQAQIIQDMLRYVKKNPEQAKAAFERYLKDSDFSAYPSVQKKVAWAGKVVKSALKENNLVMFETFKAYQDPAYAQQLKALDIKKAWAAIMYEDKLQALGNAFINIYAEYGRQTAKTIRNSHAAKKQKAAETACKPIEALEQYGKTALASLYYDQMVCAQKARWTHQMDLRTNQHCTDLLRQLWLEPTWQTRARKQAALDAQAELQHVYHIIGQKLGHSFSVDRIATAKASFDAWFTSEDGCCRHLRAIWVSGEIKRKHLRLIFTHKNS